MSNADDENDTSNNREEESDVDTTELRKQQTSAVEEHSDQILSLTVGSNHRGGMPRPAADRGEQEVYEDEPIAALSEKKKKKKDRSKNKTRQQNCVDEEVMVATVTRVDKSQSTPPSNEDDPAVETRDTLDKDNSKDPASSGVLSQKGSLVGTSDNGKNMASTKNLYKSKKPAQIGAVPVAGMGADGGNALLSAARGRDDDTLTVTATAVEDDQEVEQRVREQILNEAVEAQVLTAQNTASAEDSKNGNDVDGKPSKKSCCSMRRLILLLVLLAAGLAGGIVGAIVISNRSGSNDKNSSKAPPPPPKDDNGGGGSSSSSTDGGGKNNDEPPEGGGDGGGNGGQMNGGKSMKFRRRAIASPPLVHQTPSGEQAQRPTQFRGQSKV